MNIDFTNQVVIVTGAGRGIGGATARLYSELGASVVCVDYDRIALGEMCDSINDGGRLAI